jgi:hypothetical protein
MFEIKSKGHIIRGYYDDQLLLEQKIGHHLNQSPDAVILYAGPITEQGKKLWGIRISFAIDRVIWMTLQSLDQAATNTIRFMMRTMTAILDQRRKK